MPCIARVLRTSLIAGSMPCWIWSRGMVSRMTALNWASVSRICGLSSMVLRPFNGVVAGRSPRHRRSGYVARRAFAHFDRRPVGGRAAAGDGDCLVARRDIDQEEAADHLLGFGERPVAQLGGAAGAGRNADGMIVRA